MVSVATTLTMPQTLCTSAFEGRHGKSTVDFEVTAAPLHSAFSFAVT